MSTAVTEKKPQALTLRQQLSSPGMIEQLRRVLPKHVTPERMARVALTALTRTPKLADCDQASFFQCLLSLSQWGLEPDGRRAHLIPFENRKRGVTECQLIIDYKGLVELAYRSGFVKSIHADVIREGDLFEYSLGKILKHVPHFLRVDAAKPENAGKIIAVYCIAEMTGETVKTEVLSKEEVDQVRSQSKAGNSGPWVTHYNEMAKKTAFRRCSKWLPLSAEFRDALERDDDKRENDVIEHAPRQVMNLDDLSDRIAGKNQPAIEHDEANQGELQDDGNQELAYRPEFLEAAGQGFLDCENSDQVSAWFEKQTGAAETDEERTQLTQMATNARARIKKAK
jgi:recombination protein RecT